ncbi:MAG: phosphatidylserine decarboxylase family protein [Paludibacteraceae bacterium]|nr:phosphatidylserine decarboxylase family protein [Paludibacteraceae bacterium]
MTRRLHIHREGKRFLIVIAFLVFVINVVVYLLSPHWAFAVVLVLSAALLCFITFFFRNPVRVMEVDDPNFIISPCDGKVVVIEPVEEADHFHGKRLQVSIFMSPFNVHANWYPIEGTILRSEHQSGRHMGAWLPKSSTENERSLVVIETPSKAQVMVRQIAGAMARRVVTYAKVGGMSHRNEHLGFIKFGSRVDMYLPLDTDIYVDYGDSVRGNETVIGKLREHDKEDGPASSVS